jgi:hypothetical protein
VQGSGADTCAGLASASRSCGDPLLAAHDISESRLEGGE